jgi:DNA polymerase I
MRGLLPELKILYHQYREGVGGADISKLVITRRIGRETYQKRCIPQAVIDTYRAHGVDLVPGMDASYLVRDEKSLQVDPAFDPKWVDVKYYQRLIDKAWEDVFFVFKQIRED